MAHSVKTRHSNGAGQQRHDELLAAACDYLLAEGLHDFSVRQVAKHAGTTHRVVLYHFGSAENLLREALNAIRAPILERAAGSAADPLGFVASLLGDRSPASDVLFHGLLRAALEPDKLRDVWTDSFDAYSDLIAAHLPAALDDQTRTDVAALVLCAYRGALLDAGASGDPTRALRALALFAGLLDDRYGVLSAR